MESNFEARDSVRVLTIALIANDKGKQVASTVETAKEVLTRNYSDEPDSDKICFNTYE